MKVKKVVHKVYKEWEDTKKKGHKIPLLVGKYQYIFSNSKGEISLIKERRNYNKSPDFWEIYCLKGGLFKDVERFYNMGKGISGKAEAIKKIKEYLGVDELYELVQKKLTRIKNEKEKHKTKDFRHT